MHTAGSFTSHSASAPAIIPSFEEGVLIQVPPGLHKCSRLLRNSKPHKMILTSQYYFMRFGISILILICAVHMGAPQPQNEL